MDRFAAACCQAQSLASAQGRPWYVIDRPSGIAITPRIGDAVGYTNLHKFLPVNNDVLGYSTRRLCRSSG